MTVASCSSVMLSFMISLYGIVSEVDWLSRISVSHLMLDLEPSAVAAERVKTAVRHFAAVLADRLGNDRRRAYPARGGSSWRRHPDAGLCPPRRWTGRLPFAPRPFMMTAGYFIVSLEPMLPSTHSIVASSYATARFVTRLYTLWDQFWIVV